MIVLKKNESIKKYRPAISKVSFCVTENNAKEVIIIKIIVIKKERWLN
jgi:hypothetical protein